MPKQLKAKVTLDVKSAEKKLDALAKHINKIDRAVNQTSNSAGRMTNALNRTIPLLTRAKITTDKWAQSANKAKRSFKETNSAIDDASGKLKGFMAAVAGVMGMRVVINASDVITSAENRLNNLNGNDAKATQETLDKVFGAAQNARTGYTDMLGNVSKSMTLAPDAFQGNIDNAIRFQEIMAKSYAIGGASAAEQASSMYQMVQALGSGILQGDELRSVREGAPLAYNAIEQFAQKVLETDESLKDLASQGKITSDLVVAAMMDAGAGIDDAFANTQMTFAQAWTNIKNTATKAFEPVLQQLNDILNSDAGQAAIQGVTTALLVLAKITSWVLTGISNGLNWIYSQWSWLQYVVYAFGVTAVVVLGVLFGALIYNAITGIWRIIVAIGLGSAAWFGWVLLIGVVVAAIVWAANVAVNGLQFVITALLVVGMIILAIGAIMNITWMMWVGGILIVASVFLNFADYIMAVILGAVSVIWNLFVTLVTFIIQGALLPLFTAWDIFANFFGNLFNNPISNIIHMFEGLAVAVLGILRTIVNAIDSIFGQNLASAVDGWISQIHTKANDLADKYDNGSYEQKSNQAEQLNNALSGMQTKLSWDTSDAYKTGFNIGTNIKNGVGNFGGKVQDWINGFSITDAIGLNTDLGNFDSGQFGNGYDTNALLDDIARADDKTAGNTKDIANAVNLTAEDLEYLRKVAEMEWKKEYTSNTINVDMSNYNTVNGESDLDGIVTKLRDKLYEELDAVANGVYA